MTLKPKPDFDSALPQDRFLAARQAKASSDETAVVDLIRQLSSDDVLVRLVANDALESITGQRYGFDADASADARRDAIGRWAAWNDARTAEVGVEGAGDE